MNILLNLELPYHYQIPFSFSMDKYRYRVLWIDDDPSEEFVNEAFEYDLDIEVKTCHNDGIMALKNKYNKFDAIILDANCKITNDVSEKPSLAALTESIHEVHSFCTLGTLIPWFVYTGGGYEGFDDLAGRIPSKREWDDRKYYNKPIDRYLLFKKLKLSVEQANSKGWKIWNIYRSVFEVFENKNPYNALDAKEKSTLLELLMAIDLPEESTKPRHLNELRKLVAGAIMKSLTNMGVIPSSIIELNGKSRHLADHRFKEAIPIHVQRSFYSIVSICQDGSHTEKEAEEGKIPAQIDKLVRDGEAPYLLRSLVFELLNILIWLNGFMNSYKDREKNLIDFKINDIQKTEGANAKLSLHDSDIITDFIEKDKEGNYHCRNMVLTYKHFGENSYQIGDKIRITKIANNTNEKTMHLYSKSVINSQKI